MLKRISELEGAALDWAVAKALGEYRPISVPNYSTDWAQGGPIIERKDINVTRRVHSEVTESGKEAYRKDGWTAYTTAASYWITPTRCNGPTPLVAAMRCYVASKLGGTVDVPDELT